MVASRTTKHSPAPAKFVKAGTDRTKRDCQAYEANSHEYRNGTKTFDFERKIYGHKAVKEALKTDQHGKCCFCEGKFEAHASGDIEHYRPKGAVNQHKDSETLYPGYYWLAYSWENLYYSCNICNSTKGSFFPLADPAHGELQVHALVDDGLGETQGSVRAGRGNRDENRERRLRVAVTDVEVLAGSLQDVQGSQIGTDGGIEARNRGNVGQRRLHRCHVGSDGDGFGKGQADSFVARAT